MAVLNPLIRMMEKRGERSSPLQSLLEGLEGEFLAQSSLGLPSYHFPRVEVHDDGKTEPPIFRGDRGDIRTPDTIRFLCLESLVEQIGSFLEGMSRIGSYPIPFSNSCYVAILPH